MMARAPRVVAELGRPETPEETADRKAASSAAYRASKNVRNLIVALLVTLAVVAVIYLAVPQGAAPEREAVDVAASAQAAGGGQDLLVPIVPDDWRANSARFEGTMWRVVYAPPSGFVRIAQGLGEGENWPAQVLGGFAPTGTVTIDGIQWDVYDIPTAAARDGVDYALATAAGADTVLIYGSMDAATAQIAAEGVSDQILTLRGETR